MHSHSSQLNILPAVAQSVVQAHRGSPGEICFVNVKGKFNRAFECVLLWMLYMQTAHLWAVQFQETGSREQYREKKPVQRTSKQSGQMSVQESRALPSPCNTLFPSHLLLLLSFLSLFARSDSGVPSPLPSREIWSTCCGLKGICSTHQVCIMFLFLWTAPPKSVKQTENPIIAVWPFSLVWL